MIYNELFTVIKSTLENDFPTLTWTDPTGNSTVTQTGQDQVNTFIRQTEQRVFNTILFPALRKNVTGTLTANDKYLALPNDWLATYSLAVVSNVTGGNLDTGTYNFLLPKDVSFMRESYPVANVTGLPVHYAVFGPTIVAGVPTNYMTAIIGPTPDQNYPAELHYFYYPISICDSADGTSWLGNNFDPVLLYGALYEGYIFMKGEADMITNYKNQFDSALALAKRLGDGMERTDTYRYGQPIVPVK